MLKSGIYILCNKEINTQRGCLHPSTATPLAAGVFVQVTRRTARPNNDPEMSPCSVQINRSLRGKRGDRTRVTMLASVPTHLFLVRTNSMASNTSWPFASGEHFTAFDSFAFRYIDLMRYIKSVSNIKTSYCFFFFCAKTKLFD